MVTKRSFLNSEIVKYRNMVNIRANNRNESNVVVNA